MSGSTEIAIIVLIATSIGTAFGFVTGYCVGETKADMRWLSKLTSRKLDLDNERRAREQAATGEGD